MNANQTDILQILSREIPDIVSLEYDASLRIDAELDSLDLSLFFFAIQEQCDVEITDEKVAELDSINAIVEWLNEKAPG